VIVLLVGLPPRTRATLKDGPRWPARAPPSSWCSTRSPAFGPGAHETILKAYQTPSTGRRAARLGDPQAERGPAARARSSPPFPNRRPSRPGKTSDRFERFFASEIIREQSQLYSQEIPHATAVVIETFKERHGAKD